MINKVTLIGRLGRDPEGKVSNQGVAITNMSIATSESWKDKSTGEKQEKTEWHRVVAFRRLAEICAQYLQKGSLVYIEGKLQTRKFEDVNGNERYITEIVANNMQMLGGRPQTQHRPNHGVSGNMPDYPDGPQYPDNDFGAEVPF